MSLVQNLKHKDSSNDRDGIDPNRLAKIIEDTYVKRNREGFKTKKSFSPSQIGYGHGKCPRYWFHAFSGAEFVESNDAKSMANMDHGTTAHERIAVLFQETGLLKESERKVIHDDPPIFGFIDLILDRAGEEVIGEFKTTRQEAFFHRKAKMEPPDYHLVQVLIYMYVEDIKHGFIVYENKNTQEILVIPVTMDEENLEYTEGIIEWMRTVRKNFEEGTLPKRPYRSNSRVCKGCPVQKHCWDDAEDGEVEIESLRL